MNSSSPSPEPRFTRTPFRTTLSSIGQVVAGRRLMRRNRSNISNLQRNPVDTTAFHQTRPNTIIGDGSSSIRVEHTRRSERLPRSGQTASIFLQRPSSASPNSLQTLLASVEHPNVVQRSHSNNSDRIRQSIRAALVNRNSFETAFQSLTNDVLSGDSHISFVVIDEIFQQLKNDNVPLNTKLLSLEVTITS